VNKYALISVSDKSKIVEFASSLISNNYQILATGNTAKLLVKSGVECIEISEYTSSPEVFDGRVKTLHPKIFSGILFRREVEEDVSQMEALGYGSIDIVCVNLYPFKQEFCREKVH